jgi:hypothetical protein
MEARARPRPTERQFSLSRALAISVLLHFVLLLLSWWMSLVCSTPAAEVPDDTVLRFTFAQHADTQEEATLDGDVPLETPDPAPSAEPQPPPDPGAQVQPPLPPSPDEQPATQPAQPQEAVEEPIETEDPPAEEATEVATPDFLEREDAALRREPGPETTPETERTADPTRSFNLDRALQDFGRELDRARDAAPPPEPPGSGPPRNVYVPDPADLSTTGYGVGNLVFETRDFDWSDYARAVYIQIWRAWHNRLLRMTDDFEKWSFENRQAFIHHQNQIMFVIERSGEVSEILVETPAGCIPLDQSATSALAEVILPPLPDAFPKDREVVHARFLATGEIRNMKRHLARLKALNYF